MTAFGVFARILMIFALISIALILIFSKINLDFMRYGGDVSDFIGKVEVEGNKIVLDTNKTLYVNGVVGTGSMRPTIGTYTTTIQIKPESESEIKVGDIISFYANGDSEHFIIHRVIRIGKDQNGTYFVTKGDNNDSPLKKEKKVRFQNIKYKTIGILY